MVCLFYCFIRQAYRTILHHCQCQLFIGGEVEVSEQQLSLFNKLVLRSYRLLHLHNHFGNGINFFHCRQNLCAYGSVCLVRKATVDTCCMLSIYSMPAFHNFSNSGGCHTHTILIVLDLLWYSDNHNVTVLRIKYRRMYRKDPYVITHNRMFNSILSKISSL